jgi:hypothetical protein
VGSSQFSFKPVGGELSGRPWRTIGEKARNSPVRSNAATPISVQIEFLVGTGAVNLGRAAPSLRSGLGFRQAQPVRFCATSTGFGSTDVRSRLRSASAQRKTAQLRSGKDGQSQHPARQAHAPEPVGALGWRPAEYLLSLRTILVGGSTRGGFQHWPGRIQIRLRGRWGTIWPTDTPGTNSSIRPLRRSHSRP